METADRALMGDDLALLPYAVALWRAARRTLDVDLALAFGAIALMVAAVLGAGLPLPPAVVGHGRGTALVARNGLRLLVFRGRAVRWAAPEGARA
jgi:Cd2+/Zn2+-exporting ATPase